jgi:hypothetical protein
MWDLIEAAQGAEAAGTPTPAQVLPPGAGSLEDLLFEQVNYPKIMSPWELRCHLAYLADHCPADPRRDASFARLDRFASGWAAAWARFGESEQGIATYRGLIAALQKDLLARGDIKLSNQVPLSRALNELIFQIALPQPRAGTGGVSSQSQRAAS